MTKTAPITATVNVDALKQMLVDAARTACTDDTLPMICGVLLHTSPKGDGTVLVATATDRFTLGQVHADATGALPEVFVPLADVKRAIKALALADPDALAELSIVDGKLRVATRGMSIDIDTYGRDDNRPDFPKFAKLFDTSNRTDEQRIALNAEKLAQFAPIAKARGIGQGSITVEMLSSKRPIHIHIGDSYRAMLMPVVMGERADVPLFLTPTEQAAADKAAAQKAEALRKAKRSAAAKKAAATRAAKKASAPAKPAPRTRRKAA